MFSLKSFDFSSVVWGNVVIHPRVEAIITMSSDCLHGELLCSITTKNESISPEFFFQNLPEEEHVTLFKLLLSAISADPESTKYTISLNTPIQVIRNLNLFFESFVNNKQRLALELLETDIQKYSAHEYGLLNKINHLPNINLWLDDFGTNQSNFDIVNSSRVNLHAIKVSKELFWTLFETDKQFLESLLSYLSKKHMVIVEGIEDKNHFKFISNLKKINMQGYLFTEKKELING